MRLSSLYFAAFTVAASSFVPTSDAQEFDIASAALAEFATYGGLDECNDDILRARIDEYWNFLGEDYDCGAKDWSGERDIDYTVSIYFLLVLMFVFFVCSCLHLLYGKSSGR